ncbi:hypothetical protein [Halomarina rubra]|uniref:Uncharacterized protein n=1 Tax=Halomarina rubra TaxID=2071873 RepID=A0ABD6AY86_9EURY|nr:hypothetical protein [Halomarina rubra]
MAPLDPGVALMTVVMLAMAVGTFATGVYLVTTNPPVDESKFVGLGSEKLTDEQLAAQQTADE